MTDPSTKAAHTDAQGRYSPAREQLHQSIVEHFMAGSKAHDKPQALFTAGGMSSGTEMLAGRADANNLTVPRGHVYVNPDAIAPMLPDYEPDYPDSSDEESGDIAKLLTAVAVKRKRHLVIAGAGNSGEGKFADKLQAARDAGYGVTARYAHVPIDTAVSRSKVDEETVRKHHASVSRNFNSDVMTTPGVGVEIYSTAGRGTPTRIAYKPAGGMMQVTQQSKYREMLAKGN